MPANKQIKYYSPGDEIIEEERSLFCRSKSNISTHTRLGITYHLVIITGLYHFKTIFLISEIHHYNLASHTRARDNFRSHIGPGPLIGISSVISFVLKQNCEATSLVLDKYQLCDRGDVIQRCRPTAGTRSHRQLGVRCDSDTMIEYLRWGYLYSQCIGGAQLISLHTPRASFVSHFVWVPG